VETRASQLNGCVYCLDTHSKDAGARGERAQRLYWREGLTLPPNSGAPDAVFEEGARWFDVAEFVGLTLAIVAINGWNRFAVGLRAPVGHYVPRYDGDQCAAAGAQAGADGG
jgi:AhpD family alkylhydroperoxidase